MKSNLLVKSEMPHRVAPENIDPKLVDAIVDAIRTRMNGKIEVHFSNGGVAKVITMPTIVYK